MLPSITVDVEEFMQELASHPNQQVFYVLQGLQHGFKLGFHSTHPLKTAKKNKPSALLHANAVGQYLDNEVLLDRGAGPIPFSPNSPFAHQQLWGNSERTTRKVALDH